jgi:hypothetical protein
MHRQRFETRTFPAQIPQHCQQNKHWPNCSSIWSTSVNIWQWNLTSLPVATSPPLHTITEHLMAFHFPITCIYNFTLCTTKTWKLHSCFYTIHKRLYPTMCRHRTAPRFTLMGLIARLDRQMYELYTTASQTTQLASSTLRLLDLSCFKTVRNKTPSVPYSVK